jgi:RimJ/RimL family protein N-acetyltransferase
MIHHFTAQAALNLLSQGNVTVTTDKRRAVNIRQSAAADLDLLIDMWRRLSARTLQLRYGAPRAHIPETTVRSEMERMLNSDPDMAATLIGTVDEAEASRAVSIVQLVQSPDDRSVAEIAIVVRDDYQREGLGRALCQLVKQVAQARGVKTLRIHTLPENHAVMRLVRSMGVRFTAETRRGETEIMLPLLDE